MQTGRLDEYKTENESWSVYTEQVELYIMANDVDDTKQVTHFLSEMGAATWIVAEFGKHKDKTFEQIVNILKTHFELQPLVISDCFRFGSAHTV